MDIHCDRCNRNLGTYLFGVGGVVEIAQIGLIRQVGLPDIICFNCLGLKFKVKNLYPTEKLK